jgi:hypothetical protein
MRKIRVDKADLIVKIREERAKHKALYDEAVIAYTEKFVEAAQKFAEESVNRARRGEGFVQFGWLPVPEEHTEDFDRALQMLDWELGDAVDLDEADFATLVQNQWGWARAFASNTTSYTVR